MSTTSTITHDSLSAVNSDDAFQHLLSVSINVGGATLNLGVSGWARVPPSVYIFTTSAAIPVLIIANDATLSIGPGASTELLASLDPIISSPSLYEDTNLTLSERRQLNVVSGCTGGYANCQTYTASSTITAARCLIGTFYRATDKTCRTCLSGYYLLPSKCNANAPLTKCHSETACTKVPAGYWATGFVYSNSLTGWAYDNTNGACFRHTTGAYSINICGAGTYSPGGLYACLGTAPGYYSLSAASAQVACPMDTYGTGGSNSAACTGSCTTPGYYCPSGSSSQTQFECPASYYCPAGKLIACTAGYMSLDTKRTSPCTAACPLGSYCTGDSIVNLCPAGSYGSVTALTSSTCSGKCLAGYACPPGSMSRNPTSAKCAAGRFSGEGAISCTLCSPGTSTLSLTGQSSCTSCGAGNFALEGAASCTACPAGSWSSDAISSTCTLCAAGTFRATVGGVSISSCVPCTEGFFCQNDGTIAPAACSTWGLGNYVCPPGTITPVLCSGVAAGSYCSNYVNIVCPIGSYCPPGATAPTACPLYLTTIAVGQSSLAACIPSLITSWGTVNTAFALTSTSPVGLEAAGCYFSQDTTTLTYGTNFAGDDASGACAPYRAALRCPVQNGVAIPTGSVRRAMGVRFKCASTTVYTVSVLAEFGEQPNDNIFSGGRYSIALDGNRLAFIGQSMDFVTSAVGCDSKWHYALAVYDGSTNRVYSDGVLVGSKKSTLNTLPSELGVAIGWNHQTNAAWNPNQQEYSLATIDSVQVWT
jgi:hypothetical protein